MKPILFNTDMVRAILDGRKTVTRRVVKPQPFMVKQQENASCWCGHFISESGKVLTDKPPYRPGDILYVRETWQYGYIDKTDFEGQYNEPFFVELPYGSQFEKDSYLMPGYYYRTEDLDGIEVSWRPSIHMPKEAARIFLRVTNVRVERLQDITEEQAKAEGVRQARFSEPSDCGISSVVYDNQGTYSGGFAILWKSTIKPTEHGIYSWAANPWVWVIEFERISKEEALQE